MTNSVNFEGEKSFLQYISIENMLYLIYKKIIWWRQTEHC